jgi:hypothetical protein
MQNEELPTMGLHGSYRDELLDAAGRVTWDSGWQKNTIVLDCRRLLAAFMKGQPNTLGIQGLWFGAGDPAWDAGLPPPPSPADTRLHDQFPYLVSVGSLQLDFMDPATNTKSVTATKILQIVATLGTGEPTWPDPTHVDGTLREFGLVGQLNGVGPAFYVLINEVRHVAIPKDPMSTLVRTIQLVF